MIQAHLADYSPVKGCMVIRPNGFSIWERIKENFDAQIKKLGVRNAYFPVFIPESFMKKEAEHVEGFAPECAVVTHGGGKKLDEPVVVRPTSETIINHMFSKWIQSHRDLPYLINQWANVVRWEMRTRLFLRTTEFLWQEGHTCHATADESHDFSLKMLFEYQKFSERVLAMPVIVGLKSESEKFPGALNTYSMEAMMQDHKALQAGTSHDLSTNFAKAFETKYLDKDNKEKLVHQTSWGVSTRLVGGLIMTHSDDKGLVLPPRTAHTHVAIVPVLGKAAKDPALKEKIYSAADQLSADIEKACASLDYEIGVEVDRDESKSPGYKFHQLEITGIPIRIEIGPRDLEKKAGMVARRDIEGKQSVAISEIPSYVLDQLEKMQTELLDKARKRLAEMTFDVENYAEFEKQVENGFVRGSWCGREACEDKIKKEHSATLRVMPLDDQHEAISDQRACCICGETKKNRQAIFAKSY